MRIHQYPLAFLIVDPGSDHERQLPIHDRMYVGRDCSGIEPDRRYLVDDEGVSRNHLEIRLDEEQDRAYIIDSSTNGTRVNGSRIEKGAAVPLHPGDRIMVGRQALEFRSDHFISGSSEDLKQTVKNISLTQMAMVVGDIITFSTISEYTEESVLFSDVDRLFGELRYLLTKHKGTVSNFIGDAFFATWELDQSPDGAKAAVSFALEATRVVNELSPRLALRDPDGKPVRMGWAVGQGLVAVSAMTGNLVTVLGDATNLTFRISGYAGRDGRSPVLSADAVRQSLDGQFRFEDPEDVVVKGRKASERIWATYALSS